MSEPIKQRILMFIKGIWFLWVLSLLINIITFFLIKFKIGPGNSTLSLRYNILVGVEWNGTGKNLLFIPGVGLMVLAINFYVFQKLKAENHFLATLSAFIAVSVELILLAAVIFLLEIN